ncbi:hypothetical protein [Dyadobacter sp. BHUBP1]|uniref:hypothetical protein n=1 Tax=Dyadobacter sp. BHUBP1 TaxID=3424178 RepID=UPI003D353BF9
MLDVVIVLVIIALVLLFLRAGRQNTIVYRKKVVPPDRGYSIGENPGVFRESTTSDYDADHTSPSGHTFQGTLAFRGGEFGGAGAGDSYGNGPVDPTDSDFVNFDTCAGDFSDSCAEGSDFTCDDFGTNDSGSGDSCSDSSGDNSAFSTD